MSTPSPTSAHASVFRALAFAVTALALAQSAPRAARADGLSHADEVACDEYLAMPGVRKHVDALAAAPSAERKGLERAGKLTLAIGTIGITPGEARSEINRFRARCVRAELRRREAQGETDASAHPADAVKSLAAEPIATSEPIADSTGGGHAAQAR